MTKDQVLERIGELINATDVKTVLIQLAEWLNGYADTIEQIGERDVKCRSYRKTAVKLTHLAEEI